MSATFTDEEVIIYCVRALEPNNFVNKYIRHRSYKRLGDKKRQNVSDVINDGPLNESAFYLQGIKNNSCSVVKLLRSCDVM